MNEVFDEQSRWSLVRYRIERADETIIEARLLASEGHYNAAMNRLYYACFYAALALLVANGVATSSHAGVKTMLGLHFVSKDLLDKEDRKALINYRLEKADLALDDADEGALFKVMFSLRHEDDYEDFIEVERADIDEYTPQVTALVNKIKDLVEVRQ